jgi:hypothetical protein
VRIDGDGLIPVSEAVDGGPARLVYAVAAARVADAMAQDILLAPLEETSLASSDPGARASGRGETRPTCSPMRSASARPSRRASSCAARLGLVGGRSSLAQGLVTQWVAEMRTRFNEDFRLLVPGEFGAYRRFVGEENLWRRLTRSCARWIRQAARRPPRLSRERVEQYNRERFGDLIAGGWIVIVDEAHRLGGQNAVARFRLGEGLAEAAPYLLLATPQGKTDAFHRILWLLDANAFPDAGMVTRERVQPYVIRTETPGDRRGRESAVQAAADAADPGCLAAAPR